MLRDRVDRSKKLWLGMHVPEIKRVPDPKDASTCQINNDTYWTAPELYMQEGFEQERRLPPPPVFDPAVDDMEDVEHFDMEVINDIQRAAQEDADRVEKFGGILSAETQVDYLLAPQRKDPQIAQQRQEFNGFLHWSLLQGANLLCCEQHDFKKAHQFVTRYLRDMDLFVEWLKHPKVKAHLKKKFEIEIKNYDRLMATVVALFIRGKIQVYEQDPAAALTSFVGAASMLSESGNMDKPKYKQALGPILMARGMCYLKLQSYKLAEDDFTVALRHLPKHQTASLLMMRAEAREKLGKIDEAREDEVAAATLHEECEIIHPGLDAKPMSWVV